VVSINNGKISIRQFQLLVILYTIGTTILVIPSALAADAKQDAWIAAIAGVCLGLFIVWLYTKLGQMMKEMNLVEYSRAVLGNILGSVVAMIFVVFGFVGAVTLLFYVGNFMTTQILIETPIQFVHLLFAAIVVMAVKLGLETIARTAEIFFPWFVLLFIALTVFLTPDMRMENVQPVFEVENKVLLRAAITFAGTAVLPLVNFLMFYPSINDPKKIGRAFMSAAVVGGIFVVGISFLSISVLGADVTERLVYPSYALAKKINVGKFIQRVEVIIAALWFISIFFKMTLYFYTCVAALAQLTRISDQRPLILPLGMLIVIYGHVVYPNVNYMKNWDTNVWIPYAGVIGLVIPLLLLTAGWLRNKTKSRPSSH
jgi:spore germination protein KB